MPVKATVEPKQIDLSIQYSLGIKGQFPHNQYENASMNLSRSEKWDVTGLTQEAVDEFYANRFVDIEKEIGDIIAAKYNKLTSEGDI